MKKLFAKIRKILHDRRTRRFLTRFVSGISAIVVFVTTYALVLPAITMEKEARCGIEVHQHDDSCYTRQLICDIPESDGHHHGESCYTITSSLNCELNEHEHSKENGCYDDDGNLICQVKEHKHNDECYEEARELTCEIPETEGHHHVDACYKKVLTCDKKVHIHSTSCYEDDDPVSETAVAAGTSSAAAVTTSAGSVSSAEMVLSFGDETGESADNAGTAGSENSVAGGTEISNAQLTDSDNELAGLSGTTDKDQYIPPLDNIDFKTVLNKQTGIYYHHLAEGETVEDSSAIQAEGWNRIPDNTDQMDDADDVELGGSDLLRAYLSYTIPAGSLNMTNPVARYRLPSNLHLTDPQVKAINENVNGIAGQYVDMSTLEITDPDKYNACLGVEAVEGIRRPDETVEDYLAEQARKTGTDAADATEYISAVVRVENVYDIDGTYGEKDACLGQDLIFTFTPYSIEKNQHEYDSAGQPIRAGKEIEGWLALDLNMGQVDFEEPEIITSTVEAAVTDKTDALSGDDYAEDDHAEGGRSEKEHSADSDSPSGKDSAAEGYSGEETENSQRSGVAVEHVERTAEIVFVEEGLDEKGNKVDKISTTLKVFEEIVAQAQDGDAERDTDGTAKEEESVISRENAADSSDNDRSETSAKENREDANDSSTDAEAAAAAKETDQVIMPAMSFSDSIIVSTGKPSGIDENTGGILASAAESLPEEAEVSVRVEADEGSFPAGTTMVLKAVDDLDTVAEAVTETVENSDPSVSTDGEGDRSEQTEEDKNNSRKGEKKNLKTYGFQAVDITFLDAEGNEIEPAKPVRVALTSKIVEQVKEEAKGSSVAEPVVVHVNDDGNTEQMDLVDPSEIEPAKGRSEEELSEKSSKTETEKEDGKKDDSEPADAADTSSTVEIQADSFSVYAIVYTVDFHWEVDGKTYEFSLPGGGFVSFSKLVEVLGITGTTNSDNSDGKKDGHEEAEETGLDEQSEEDKDAGADNITLTMDDVTVSDASREFVENVENITFSSPNLLSVSKADENTTVGEIKDSFGLECEYSAELTQEQIADINSSTVEAGDWALISILPFDTEEMLNVTMKDGEVFVIRVTDARDPLSLDGQIFTFVIKPTPEECYDQNNYYHNRPYVSVQAEKSGTDLKGNIIAENACTITNGTGTCSNTTATSWTIEYDSNQKGYYIHNAAGQYLSIFPANDDTNYDVALSNSKSGAHLMQIERNEDGTYKIYAEEGDRRKYLIYQRGYSDSGSFFASREGFNNNQPANFYFLIPEASGSNVSHKAALISASDAQPGQRIVVYQRVLQDDNTYKDYAVNGNGQLVEVYPSSDSVYWKGDQSIEWTMVDLGNGYYTLQNTVTKAYLSPKGGNSPSIVHQAGDFANADELRISLPGKDAGDYTSSISCWDYVNNVTEGLKVTRNGTTTSLSAVPYANSQQFYFASRDTIPVGQLTEVETVNSTEKGIHITMYDFSGKTSNHRMNYHNYAMGGESWGEGVLNQGIMGRTLYTGEEQWINGVLYIPGFPISDKTKRSLGLVFRDGPDNPNDYYYYYIRNQKEANHLFIQSVYDATGYFHYSSFENSARFNETTGDFTVYDQIATAALENAADWNAAYMNRGNFMPYNDLDLTSSKQHYPGQSSPLNGGSVTGNWYQSSNSNPLPDSDPRKGERLYLLKNRSDSRDYLFGMIMDAKFMQGKDGLNDRKDPIRYEFNGDDDLYVYVDGVLLLDIGGVHDAFQGYIDFTTGDIEVYPATKYSESMFRGQKTTIKRQFWDAGRFPDGTEWNHNTYPYDCDKANEYFEGETFRDYSTHDFKMFYMERGEGASNLEMQFNLMTLTESQFRVKKEMLETQSGQVIQNGYADAAFYYEAYVKIGNGDPFKVTRNYLNNLNSLQDRTPRYQDGTPVEWKTDNLNETKFVVRPGQTAVFPAAEDDVQWFVVEVEPDQNPPDSFDSHMLESYSVSNSDQDSAYPNGTRSKMEKIRNRNLVTFENRPKDELVNELRITKKITGTPYSTNDLFEYRILLESTDGNMVPYREGEYYQLDKEGRYVYFEDGQRKYSSTPRIAEHTSTNGSVNNIKDGDTIIIKGLLEGTDFYVYERTDSSYGNLSADGTLVENKYVFDGTSVSGAFRRGEDSVDDLDHPVGHLYDEPGGMTGETGMINKYHISTYEREKAAWGSILMGSDADIQVRNKPYHPTDVEVKKNWPTGAEDFNMNTDLNDAEITFTLRRYKLDARHGAVNLTGVLVSPPTTGADPVYHIVKGDQVIKSIAYTDLSNGTIAVTDLPIGQYTIQCEEYVVGYTADSVVNPLSFTVTEGEETNVTVTTTYTRDHGTLQIKKILSGDYVHHQNDKFTYTVHGPGGFTYTVEKKVSDASNGVITINVPMAGNNTNDLPTGTYIISEEVKNSNNSGDANNGKHTPSIQSVQVTSSGTAVAEFKGDYPARLIPVTFHLGHASQYNSNDWNEDYTTQKYSLPAGSTVTVTLSVRQCQYFDNPGAYCYGPTNSCSAGNIKAYGTDENVYVTKTFTFTMPSDNTKEYDYYIKSRCANATWAPTVISAIASSGGRRMMGMPRSSGLMQAPANRDSNNVKTIHNSVINPNTLPTLTAEQQAKSKFVIDDQWTMRVVMTKDGYRAYLGDATQPVLSGNITTGNSFWDAVLAHESIVVEDENGNPYYYYIASFSEKDIPVNMKPSFDMDPNDPEKTLMSWSGNKKALSVTNTYLDQVSLDIIKLDEASLDETEESKIKYLEKAEFTITQLDENGKGNYKLDPESTATPPDLFYQNTVTTDSEGKAVFEALKHGYYEIKETKAPDGYILNTEPFYVKIQGGFISRIKKTEDNPQTLDKDEGCVINWADDDNNSGMIRFSAAADAVEDIEETTDIDESAEAVNAAFTVGNTPGAALPHTGGAGTKLFTLLGSILIAGAGLLLWKRQTII